MQLEVRDNKWTDEKILYYLSWLNYIIDTDFDFFFDKNKDLFFKFLVSKKTVYEEYNKRTYVQEIRFAKICLHPKEVKLDIRSLWHSAIYLLDYLDLEV